MATRKPTPKKPTKRVRTGSGLSPRSGVAPPKSGQFKPGNNANPLGAGAHNVLPKLFKRLTIAQLTDLGHLFFQGTLEDLKRKTEDPTTTAVEHLVIQCMKRAIKEGNTSSMNALFDRFVGRVRESLHVSHSGSVNGDSVARVVVMLPDNGRSVRPQPEEQLKDAEKAS